MSDQLSCRRHAKFSMSLKLFFSHYSPPARAVLMVIRALELSNVEIIYSNIIVRNHLTPELLRVNPQHTVPTLQDKDFVIWDSHAISGYLVGNYGRNDSLYPKDPKKRAIVDQRLHLDTEILFPNVYNTIYPVLFQTKNMIPEGQQKSIRNCYRLLDTFLEKTFWLAGDQMTIADLCCVASLSSLDYFIPVSKRRFRNLSDLLERCRNLPYYDEANREGLYLTACRIQESLVRRQRWKRQNYI